MSGFAGGPERLTASADGWSFGLHFQDDGRTLEAEPLPQAVNNEALSGKVKRSTLVCEENKSRRPDRRLSDVVDLDWRFDLQRLHESIQLTRGGALRCRVEAVANQRQNLRDPNPLLG